MGDDEELPEVEYDVATSDHAVASGDRTTPTAVIIVASLVGLALLWMVSGLGSGVVDRVVPTAQEAAPDVVLVVPSPVPTPTPTSTPVPTPTPTPVPTFIEARAAQIARTQLANLGPSYTVVYATGDGLGILALSTSESHVLTVLPDEGLGLPDDATLYGLGPADLAMVLRAGADRPVALGFDTGTLAFAELAGTLVVLVDADTGITIDEYAIPTGAALREIDGYGVVAYVEGEGTYVARRSGMTLLTEGEVLDGNDVAWLERRCSGPCEVILVDRSTGDMRVLPETFVFPGDRYLISPNAEFVLRVSEAGFGELVEPSTGSIQLAASEGLREAAWSPDSLFLAWIDSRVEPELRLLLPGRRDLVVVRLDLLGAPAPVPAELRVLIQAG